jgi:hypothetical protein
MARVRYSRRERAGRRRFSRPVGCLFWVLLVLAVLLVLSLLFGGFQKGQKVGLDSVTGQRVQPALQELALGRIAGPGDR